MLQCATLLVFQVCQNVEKKMVPISDLFFLAEKKTLLEMGGESVFRKCSFPDLSQDWGLQL